jgi:hypothetical protein
MQQPSPHVLKKEEIISAKRIKIIHYFHHSCVIFKFFLNHWKYLSFFIQRITPNKSQKDSGKAQI